MQDDHENWNEYSTTAILNLNFWTKSEIKYLQNDASKIQNIGNKKSSA